MMKSNLFSAQMGLLVGLPIFMLAAPAAHAQAPAAHAPAPTALADMGLYPNPAHIRATVEVPAVAGATRATITLLDAQGSVVFEQPVSLTDAGGTAEVPLLGRAPGLYRVQVQAGDRRVAKTLRVE